MSKIRGIDYIEFYVANAKQSVYWWKNALGFTPIARIDHVESGSGSLESASYVLRQGKINVVLTSPLKEGGLINESISKHGDYAIKVIGLEVDDSKMEWEKAIGRGAKSFLQPKKEEDEKGSVILSGVFANWGDQVVHIFVERNSYHGRFLPGFEDIPENPDCVTTEPLGFKWIDHIVPNVDNGRLKQTSDFYRNIFDFQLVYELKVQNEYSEVDLEVMSNKLEGEESVKFNIIQPQDKNEKKKSFSFAKDFMEWYNGEGINHICLCCDDIIKVISEMRKRGVEFYEDVPDIYYDTMIERIGNINEDVEMLKKQRILVAKDEDGYLLQIFTKPFGTRQTTYLEIMERKGASFFGDGNVVRELKAKGY